MRFYAVVGLRVEKIMLDWGLGLYVEAAAFTYKIVFRLRKLG